jgi:hypothetical protein
MTMRRPSMSSSHCSFAGGACFLDERTARMDMEIETPTIQRAGCRTSFLAEKGLSKKLLRLYGNAP